MKQFLPKANVDKLLLDSAHDAMTYYEYCRDNGITPFIDLNGKGGRYRSSKMWYCRLFCIMMCQRLDAWNLPKTSLKDFLKQVA